MTATSMESGTARRLPKWAGSAPSPSVANGHVAGRGHAVGGLVQCVAVLGELGFEPGEAFGVGGGA